MKMRVDMLGSDDLFTGYRTGLAADYAYSPFLGDDASDAADEAKRARLLAGYQSTIDILPNVITAIGDTLSPSQTPVVYDTGATPASQPTSTGTKTDYMPWIIGGIAAVVLLGGTGILMRRKGGRRRRR